MPLEYRYVESYYARLYHVARVVGGAVLEVALCGYRPKNGWTMVADEPESSFAGCGRCDERRRGER